MWHANSNFNKKKKYQLKLKIKKKKKIINMKLNFFFQIPNPLAQPFTVQSPWLACSNSSKIVTYII
jgi:hypothetical protein